MGESGKAASSSSPSNFSSGPPWLFRGRALYQLHLVKAEIARAFIPKELKLVEVFGYTLGGLFLAHYDDSPAGAFDELVVITGIVWNPPTSCAWASRVLVNSDEACRHGKKEIGLPSHVAIFSEVMCGPGSMQNNKRNTRVPYQSAHKNKMSSSYHSKTRRHSEIEVQEMEGSSQIPICNIGLALAGESWMGPKIKMSLPSYSGRTIHNPDLLKYSCQIECRVRAARAAKISRPVTVAVDSAAAAAATTTTWDEDERNKSIAVLLSKPVIALEFNLLSMRVEAPQKVKDVAAQSTSNSTQVGSFKKIEETTKLES